jgi:hypothetical protein
MIRELVLGGEVKTVIHASDIHIRTGDLERSRFVEYEEVFKAFIEGLPVLGETGVVVLTGDIFHNKGKIEPAGICLAHFLLDALLERSDVLMICGNHDYRQEDPDIPDMIYSMYHRYFEHRVQCKYKAYYLDKTGYYRYKNILFSVLDIRDVLKSYNTVGRVEGSEAVGYPPVLAGESGVKVGLFHGFYSSKEVGCVPEFNPQWLGYDFMLLGDIHKGMVVRQGECVWGYPGSLVQQDFGESYFDHGYLVWDVAGRKAESVEVVNRWGFCTVQCRGEELYVHVRGKKWISAGEMGQFPDKAIVRVLQKEDIEKVREYFGAKGMALPRGIQVWNGGVVDGGVGSGDGLEDGGGGEGEEAVPRHGLEELNASDKWLEFLGEDSFREFIEDPHRLLLPAGDYGEIGKKVQERNGKITKAVDEFVNYCTVEGAPRVHLRKMEWAYIMCYGEGNSFDFDKIDGQIALLNGKNAMGKSSFMDVICIGLFGDPTKMRQMVTGKKYSDKIIHSCKPGKVAPFVRVQLEVNGEVFEIYRAFGSQSSRENSILQTAVKVFRVGDSGSVGRQIMLEGVTLVDKWVAKTVGSMEAVLMSTMLCQVDLNNFFYLKQEDQRGILDRALQLDKVSLYGKILKEACLGYGDVLQAVQTAKGTVLGMMQRSGGGVGGGSGGLSEEEEVEISQLKELKKIYGSYITKKVPGRDCERKYKEAELEWQLLGLAGVDLEGYYRCKERLERLEQQYEAVKDKSVFKNGEELLEKTLVKYEAFKEKKPKCDVSETWVKQRLAEYEKWCKGNEEVGGSGSGSGLEELELVLKEVEKKRLGLRKPAFKKCRVVSEEVGVPVRLINLEDYAHLEGVVLPKKKGWRKKVEELKRVEKVLELGDKLGHNDDCEVCCANREYLDGLCSYKSGLEKSLEEMSGGEVDWERLEQAAVYQENRDYNDWLWFVYEKESKSLEKEYKRVKAEYERVSKYEAEKAGWEKTMEKVRGYQEQLADYEVWCQEDVIMQEKIKKYEAGVNKKKLEKELGGVREAYEKLRVGVESFLRYEQYKNEWFNYKLAEVEKRLSDLQTRKIKWLAQKEQLEKQKVLLDKYGELEGVLEGRLEVLRKLETRFMGDKNHEGYKEWIYKEKVVPLLNKYMNGFLEQFESFTFKMEYKNKAFVYLLQDRGNEPTLDKASGYQNFITGLGLRITLAMLGAVGQQFKHLFIDEGFTACDMGNMAKVPLLLKSVMTFGQYKSIVLMSHLENVRECASRVIDIERRDPYSFIRF